MFLRERILLMQQIRHLRHRPHHYKSGNINLIRYLALWTKISFLPCLQIPELLTITLLFRQVRWEWHFKTDPVDMVEHLCPAFSSWWLLIHNDKDRYIHPWKHSVPWDSLVRGQGQTGHLVLFREHGCEGGHVCVFMHVNAYVCKRKTGERERDNKTLNDLFEILIVWMHINYITSM